MLRCEQCGGHASPGLAHLHGNPCRHLCISCTKRELERQELGKAERDREDRQAYRLAQIDSSLNKAA